MDNFLWGASTCVLQCRTLRLYNTASATARHATKDFVAAGHAIPKGTQVVTANLAMHTDPEVRSGPGGCVRDEGGRVMHPS